MTKQYLYRYVDGWHAGSPVLNEYEVRRETPCGYWAKRWPWSGDDDLRWVAKKGKNNFAKATKAEAMENYYHRKRRQVQHLQAQLDRAQKNLRYAEHATKRNISKMTDLFWAELPY